MLPRRHTTQRVRRPHHHPPPPAAQETAQHLPAGHHLFQLVIFRPRRHQIDLLGFLLVRISLPKLRGHRRRTASSTLLEHVAGPDRQVRGHQPPAVASEKDDRSSGQRHRFTQLDVDRVPPKVHLHIRFGSSPLRGVAGSRQNCSHNLDRYVHLEHSAERHRLPANEKLFK